MDDLGPIGILIAGVVNGTIKATEAGAKLAKYFKDKQANADLQLIGNAGTIADVKAVVATPEYSEYQKLLDDSTHLQAIRIGLVFRTLVQNPDELMRSKDHLQRRGGRHAVLVAQCAQIGIVGILRYVIERGGTDSGDLRHELNQFLARVGDFTLFVRSDEDVDRQARIVYLRVHANNPSIFVVSGAGYAADIAKEIGRRLKDEFPEHTYGHMGDARDYQAIFTHRRH